MKVELTQVEIEQAIKDYVSQRVAFDEGTVLVVGLVATRGEDGFKASIESVNPESIVATQVTTKAVEVVTETAKAEPVKAKPAKVAFAGKKKEVPEPVLEQEPEAVTVEVEQIKAAAVTEEVQEAEPVVEDKPPFKEDEPAQEEETVQVAAEAEEEVVEQPKARPSLFAGLKKPVNS